jgi:hypothetical protein
MGRTGKIARLPQALRAEVNRRLENNEPGETLLGWLNGLPEVKELLAREFDGVAISECNLSGWRTGSYQEWQARKEMMAEALEFSAEQAELYQATKGQLPDHLATMVSARYVSALRGWDGEETEELNRKLRLLQGVGREVIRLRRSEQEDTWLHLEARRLGQKRKNSWEQWLANFAKLSKNPELKEWICREWPNDHERLRGLYKIFNSKMEEPYLIEKTAGSGPAG